MPAGTAAFPVTALLDLGSNGPGLQYLQLPA
jgi:hypothetical protein